MRQAIMPHGVDDFRGPCDGDPCSGVRSIGEVLRELLGTIDCRQRRNVYDVSGPFRLAAASGRDESFGR